MNSQWYFYKDGQQQGPFSWEVLCQKAQSGAFGPADLIWTDGMENWIRADRVEGLFTVQPSPPASSPAPAPSPASTYHSQGPAGYKAAPARKKGKGGLIALVVILVLVLAGGGFFALYYLSSDSVNEFMAEPDHTEVEEKVEAGEEPVEERMPEELAALVEHFQKEGLEVDGVHLKSPQVVSESGAIGAIGLLIEGRTIELMLWDFDTADEETVQFVNERIQAGRFVINGNITLFAIDFNILDDRVLPVFESFRQ